MIGALVLVLALTASEQRGREIYRDGTSPSGRAVTAIIGKGETTELPASALACGSCHGIEGRGVPEGTIEPADIRGMTLANILIGKRRRPRYDDALLARAIREGRDSGDMPLSPVMPRYRMDDRDLADLLAYLPRLGNEPQPGLADESLTVATLLPLSGARSATGELTRKVIDGYFADINAQGGIHGRKLQLRAIDSMAKNALQNDDAFAVLCAAEIDDSAQTLIDRERIPLVTPLPFDANSTAAASSFFLFSNLESQAVALAKHVGAGKRDVYLLHGKSAMATAAAAAIEERADALQWTIRKALPEGGARENDLLFLIDVDPDEVLRGITASQAHPRVLIAGAQLRGIPSYPNQILIATPTVPSDLTAEGRHELQAFAARHELPAQQLAVQIAAYSAAKVFVEGLKRAGRELTRERLIAQLETLYQYPTNLTPPVTFHRGRHAGANGAYILAVDSERRTFVPASGWIDAK